MFRRLAHITFYLWLLVSGEEFEGIAVDAEVSTPRAVQLQ